MATLLHKPSRIEVDEIQPSVRSDWKLGIQIRGYRGEFARRAFRLTFSDQSRALWQHLSDLFVEAGCGAGEITWPDAPEGSAVVRMPTMPTVAQSAQRYQITAELVELLSTDT